MLLVSAGVLIPRLLPQLPTLPLPLIAPLVAPTDSTYWLTRSWFLRGLGGIFFYCLLRGSHPKQGANRRPGEGNARGFVLGQDLHTLDNRQ